MYFLYLITTASTTDRGVVSYSELPDLLYRFKAAALGHSAKFTYVEGGVMVARKNQRIVTLSVTSSIQPALGRCVFDSIEAAMDLAFANNDGLSEQPTMFGGEKVSARVTPLYKKYEKLS